MRKLIYGSLFLALVSILIVGCEKNEIDPISNEQPTSSNVKKSNSCGAIGDAHNEFLEDYLVNGNDMTDSSMSVILMDFFNFSVQKHPELANYEQHYIDAIDNLINANNISELYIGMKLELDELKAEGRVTDGDYNSFSGILTSESLPRYPLVLENVNSADAFNSVYCASSDFWSAKDLDRTERTIIADAIGGGLWWWSGAFAPFIAAGYSLAVYNV